MRTDCVFLGLGCLLLGSLGGCPPAPSGSADSVVQAAIAASISTGDAPLTVLFSGASSSSPNGGPYRFSWDFNDGSSSTEAEVSHTFASPGLYSVRLTVTDAKEKTGTAEAEIRARGIGATAVIMSDRTSGPAPLLVRFDGGGSFAPDDRIRDYFWDFGDGQTDRARNPTHQFTAPGTFTVMLRVATAGGVEDEVTADIRVDTGSASLDFSTGEQALLPITGLGAGDSLERLTVELWFKAAGDGGLLFNLGGGSVALRVNPAAGRLTLQLSAVSTDLPANQLADRWRHVAVTYNADGIGATVYLDGEVIGTAPLADPPARSVASLVLGGGEFFGTLADVRLWSSARTQSQIAANRSQRLTGNEPGLERYWPLNDDGDTQFLDEVASTDVGVRGTTAAAEPSDPAWTTDAPPLSD